MGLETYVVRHYIQGEVVDAIEIDTKYNLSDIGAKPIEKKNNDKFKKIYIEIIESTRE